MKKGILYAVIASIICCNYACNKESGVFFPENVNYPTTINCLPEETLKQMRDDFAQRNPFFFSNLNQFGFCALVDGSYGMPVPSGEVFSEEEAITAVKEFVARNPEYTGVNNHYNLQFERVTQAVGTNREISWVLWSKSQIINGTEIIGTGFVFHTRYREVVGAWGHFFPNIYLPEKFNLDVEKAKSRVFGKEIVHLDFAGREYSVGNVTKKHLQECPTSLIIIPFRTDEKIELRIAWKIDLGWTDLHYIFYVDVMTGKIIGEEPTIIS